MTKSSFLSFFIFFMTFTTVLGFQRVHALSPQEKVPNFSLKNQDGKDVSLSEHQGKYVVLYFYPKDATPGCTKEACSFRDDFKSFQSANTVVLGISMQDEKSHKDFSTQHKLPFDLLVDSDGSVAKKLGIELTQSGLTQRQTLLVDDKGKLVKIYKNVDPALHSKEILSEIGQFRKAEKY